MKTEIGNTIGIALLLAGMTLGGVAFGADVMVAASVKQEGSFEGFENARFIFRNSKGRIVKQHYGQVSKLVLESPRSVWVTLKGVRKEQEKAVCKGFEKSKFIIEQEGKIVNQPADKIARIEIAMEDNLGNQAGAGGLQNIDTNALLEDLKGQPPTPVQTAALDRYSAAKQKLDSFAGENAAMKAEFERAAGPRRAELMEQLRVRKHDEQTFLNDVRKTEKELITAF